MDTLLTGPGTTAENTGVSGGEDLGIEAMSDDELVGYLLASAEEACELAQGAYEARVTGDTTKLPMEGACRDVLLGMASGGDFHVAIHYTIAPSGIIYKNFPEDGDWGIIYRPGFFG
jgi:hypothetical protein